MENNKIPDAWMALFEDQHIEDAYQTWAKERREANEVDTRYQFLLRTRALIQSDAVGR